MNTPLDNLINELASLTEKQTFENADSKRLAELTLMLAKQVKAMEPVIQKATQMKVQESV
jgi:hypothetical protein